MHQAQHQPRPLELWGGVECSRVRLPDHVADQLKLTGHENRLDDLDRFAALGLRTLRFPLLWEKHGGTPIDWSWPDRWLARMRELQIRPIVGFVHHGSGATRDGLADPAFAPGLARFARRVAERYPWLDAFTPVNEPLTTARFSALYGIWHPFQCHPSAFVRTLLHQLQGVRSAMRAIREVIPHAQLVQTEDVGKTHSTPRLAYQAQWENERRWLTFDLLCGRVDDAHPIRPYLEQDVSSRRLLDSFLSDPCPPDVLGMNTYVTSERFLDERLDRYPPYTHGGNHRERYADVDAVRVRAEGLDGPASLMRELWQRYQRPIAVTEVQLACTREEQLRWLLGVWKDAHQLRAEGAHVLGVTVWSLLGAYDWDSLLVEPKQHYECGAFDVRSGRPRPTALARAIRDLIASDHHEHPVLEVEGWWRRPLRLLYPPVSAPGHGGGTAVEGAQALPRTARPILVTGAAGALGSAVMRLCQLRGLPAVALPHSTVDINDTAALERLIATHRPWAIVNAAGFVRVDDAELHPDACSRANLTGPALLAGLCAEHDLAFVTFSTALVFDGRKTTPYDEHDRPYPIQHYGRSKWRGEQAVAQRHTGALIIRSGPFFGPWDRHTFAHQTLARLAGGETVAVADDVVVTPTYLPDLVQAALDLLVDGEAGTVHLANDGSTTWADWARQLAERAALDVGAIHARPLAELGLRAPRPRFSALTSQHGRLLPPWEDALDRYMLERISGPGMPGDMQWALPADRT